MKNVYISRAVIRRMPPVYHINQLPEHFTFHPADIGILTVPEQSAQELADALADYGIRDIWNFTNAELTPKRGRPIIENVHFFGSLFSLCCRTNGYDTLETSAGSFPSP